jgi:hypothetical protein
MILISFEVVKNLWFANLNVLIGQFMGEWSFGQLMGQNNKVVHWLPKTPEKAELIMVLRAEASLLTACSSDHMRQNNPFRSFLPYPGWEVDGRSGPYSS